MNTKELIYLHQTCIEILEAIQTFEVRKKMSIMSKIAPITKAYFPELVQRYEHQIDIYERCIARLRQRYDKALDEITQGKLRPIYSIPATAWDNFADAIMKQNEARNKKAKQK